MKIVGKSVRFAVFDDRVVGIEGIEFLGDTEVPATVALNGFVEQFLQANRFTVKIYNPAT